MKASRAGRRPVHGELLNWAAKIRCFRVWYHAWMVRPVRRAVLAGESPARVSAGAPGSRLQPGGEIQPGRAECRKPFYKEGEQTSGPQQSVNAIASSDSQPKGVRESQDAHFTVKATDNILDRNGCWISPGSQAVARWDRTARNRGDPTWQPGRARARI